MTVCAFVEWPDGLTAEGEAWRIVCEGLRSLRPDVLVTNELPFGGWLPTSRAVEHQRARACVEEHERGLRALLELPVPVIISSRPVWLSEKLGNEAFVIEDRKIRGLHRKKYFPDEEGWLEATWFQDDGDGHAVHDVKGLKIGVLLCTELMFNEHARRYGQAGADLIVVPRATGTTHRTWATAAAMAAIVSGSYVVSSNRVGGIGQSPLFGGRGFAFGPDGVLLDETSNDRPLVAITIDLEAARKQKLQYPCYVKGSP